MSGFALDWLRLREPLDGRSRATALVADFAAALPERPALLDLGAGTGSTLRQLAPRLGRAAQGWTLLDNDPALLAQAPREIADWAASRGWQVSDPQVLGQPGSDDAGIALRGPDLTLDVETRRFDLTGDPAGLALGRYDGILASALLDLVSAAWVGRFVAALAAAGRPPLLLGLTVDGRVAFTPPLDDDALVLACFHGHMRRDKGFGPALGPAAAATLAGALDQAGYRVALAPSDWCLGAEETAVQRLMIDGYARSAGAQDPAVAGRIGAWAGRRQALLQAGGAALAVGHTDLLALPRRQRC
ncbi:class I SAM-dependent methyltransferase [Oleisolibacter albus]|uniref:class I SAM-dependent methyltransferase n=1 Tax=Oleisolibacter albus TaxID=2171757 RepID=UPI000DF28072|nr:class I SAM-dependent methyltransferase [Oleisolibacter albus]